MSHGLFDVHIQLHKIDQNGDPLVKINQLVNWELFRKDLQAARDQARGHERTSDVGRPPIDVILLFKMLILQSLHNLSDEALEKQSLDRLTFMRFLGLDIGDGVPDAKTIWAFKEMLKQNDLAKTLFLRFDTFLRANGYEAKQGQIVDATIVQSRIRRDSREVNKQVKEGDGENVKQWSDHTRCQKDIDARWTKKRNKSYFGYKDHESVDVKHKFIREYHITPASVHDSNVYEELITPNEHVEEYADSAYRSEDRMTNRVTAEKIPHFQEKGTRGHPLTADQQLANRLRSKVRSRVEHVFGAKLQRAGNLIVRTIGIARARVKLGLRNLAYNLERYAMLRRRKLAAIAS
jgi:IS5 family transposase